jgi:hypothetical protein
MAPHIRENATASSFDAMRPVALADGYALAVLPVPELTWRRPTYHRSLRILIY